MSLTIEEIQTIESAFNIIREKVQRYDSSQIMDKPDTIASILRLKVGHLDVEKFGLVYLTTQNNIIDIETIISGTIDAASVYPREVVKSVLKHEAAAVMFFHNHPSGKCEPSIGDERITQKLIAALNTIDVRTLDHFIITSEDHYSFAEHGKL